MYSCVSKAQIGGTEMITLFFFFPSLTCWSRCVCLRWISLVRSVMVVVSFCKSTVFLLNGSFL